MDYVMKKCSRDKLERAGFVYSPKFSRDGESIYKLRFDAYRYRKEVPSIECEISVCAESGETEVNVFDKHTRSRYASWYLQGTLGYEGKNEVVDIINRHIETKLESLGVKEVVK